MPVIYALLNKDGVPIYVGATKDMKRRLKERRRKFGCKPDYTILCEAPHDWRPLEHEWIERMKAEGYPLLNKTKGGDGWQTASPETREKVAAAMRGRKVTWGWKISEASKGQSRNWTPEGEQRVRATQFKPGQNAFESLTDEQKQRKIEASRKTAQALTSEERARRNRLAWASMTLEQKAERGRKIAEGQRRGRVGDANRTPERRAENGRKSRDFWASITPERKAEIARKREAARQATLALRRAEGNPCQPGPKPKKRQFELL